MDSHGLVIAAIEKGKFAKQLADMFWQAYGGLLKTALIIGVCFFVITPIVVFVRKLMR